MFLIMKTGENDFVPFSCCEVPEEVVFLQVEKERPREIERERVEEKEEGKKEAEVERKDEAIEGEYFFL